MPAAVHALSDGHDGERRPQVGRLCRGSEGQLAVPGIKPEIAEDGTLWSGGLIQDWDGNVLWEFYPPRDVGISVADMPFHHDMKRIWNKKLNQWTQLIVSNRTRTKAEAVPRGGIPA